MFKKVKSIDGIAKVEDPKPNKIKMLRDIVKHPEKFKLTACFEGDDISIKISYK